MSDGDKMIKSREREKKAEIVEVAMRMGVHLIYLHWTLEGSRNAL